MPLSHAPSPPTMPGSGSHARVARRAAWLVATILLCLFLGASGVLSQVASKLNEEENLRSQALASRASEAWLNGITYPLLDFAHWDEAYEHTLGNVDEAWAAQQVGMGRSLLAQYGLNGVFILDAQNETRYAFAKGQFNTRHANEWIDGDLAGLLAEARSRAGERIAVKRYFTVEGRPAMVAAAAIRPLSYHSKAPVSELACMVFVDIIGPGSLARMGELFGLPGLREVPAEATVGLALSEQPPLYLTWDVARPGATFLAMMLPLLVMATLLFGIGAWLLLRRSIRAAEQVDHGCIAQAHVAYLSRHDSLTGLPNRSHAYQVLQERLAGVAQGGAFAVLYIDLSGFKQINDCLGHIAGDQVLTNVARRLQGALGHGDFLARLGGDEFLVITPQVCPEHLKILCQSLLRNFDPPLVTAEHELRLGLCIGIAQAPMDSTDGEELLRLADIALYEAKARGQHCWQLYNAEMKTRILERRSLEQDLKRAVQQDEFIVVFQPRFGIDGRRILGAEALVRWQHPEKGLLSPGVFIPLAEETGLIVGLSDIVLRRACELVANMPEPIFVSVNLSCIEFMRADLVNRVEQALAVSGLPPCQLEIEVTESVMIDNAEGALALMTQLKTLGVKLSMDDFGTGYSSLGYLSCYPFDGIKIDRSFVMNLTDPKANNEAIVSAVIAMGKSLGMAVTAEGVETAEQLEALAALGCDQAQGYLLGRPMTPQALIALLDEQHQEQLTSVAGSEQEVPQSSYSPACESLQVSQ